MASETPISEEEVSIAEQIKTSLRGLEETNKKAYDLLISRVDMGFFETRKTPKPLKELANQLLETIDERQDTDEN